MPRGGYRPGAGRPKGSTEASRRCVWFENETPNACPHCGSKDSRVTKTTSRKFPSWEIVRRTRECQVLTCTHRYSTQQTIPRKEKEQS
jgi:hypothetical protein